MAKDIYLKRLHLITPEAASVAGITAEAPILVSPDITYGQDCRRCQAHFTPLVYSVPPNELIIAQHFHEEGQWGGGIYTTIWQSWIPHKWTESMVNAPWVAEVELIGRRVTEGSNISRAEAIAIHRILGFEEDCRFDKFFVRPLTEGVLVYQEYESARSLVPVSYEKAETTDPRLLYCQFHTRDDGTVAFSFLEGENSPRNCYWEYFAEKTRRLFSDSNE